MPLGIDTVSLFGLTFGALGPVYRQTRRRDPLLAGRHGAHGGDGGLQDRGGRGSAARLRRFVPPAAMLGTIGGIGIALIAFMPMLKIFATPPSA